VSVRVVIFVEGSSDAGVLKVLIEPMLRERGIGLSRIVLGSKPALLNKAPREAAARLQANPRDLMIALPDLYPMREFDNTSNRHRSPDELQKLLEGRFAREARARRLPDAVRERFKVHCFKHDLEVLLLACPRQLFGYLRAPVPNRPPWVQPVEDQNDQVPPKEVVDKLFVQHKKTRYNDVLHAPEILKKASLADLERECSQCFKPLLDTLRAG
jgi:hypothetical protein